MTRVLVIVIACAFAGDACVSLVRAQTGQGGAKKPLGKSSSTSKKPKTKAVAPAVSTFEARRADWIRRKEAASEAGATGPDPLEQYLVSEVLVTGLFETDTGFGAFLHATPTGNTFFASNGAKLYNGRLVSIEKHAGGFADDVQIVFEERVGKGTPQRVVKRVVAVPSKVEDVETAPAPAEKPAKEAPESDKPAPTMH